jgi:hypothetical protein
MRGLVIWLMGEELGESIMKSLHWLLETPPDRSQTQGKTSDEITIEHITQVLESMQSKVAAIQSIIDRVRRITHEIQHRYNLKRLCHQELIGVVLEAKRTGNIIEARLAMTQMIQIERILPELQSRLDSSQDLLIGIHEIHAQEESNLSLLEIDLETVKARRTMNSYQNVDNSADLIVLYEKFRNVQSDLEYRHQEIQVASTLNNPSNCELGETLTTEAIDELIEKLNGAESMKLKGDKSEERPDRSHTD